MRLQDHKVSKLPPWRNSKWEGIFFLQFSRPKFVFVCSCVLIEIVVECGFHSPVRPPFLRGFWLHNLQKKSCWLLHLSKHTPKLLSLHIFPVRFQVVAPINKLIETVPFDAFFYSLDWHPADHISFIENVANRKLDDSSSITDASKVSTYDTVSVVQIHAYYQDKYSISSSISRWSLRVLLWQSKRCGRRTVSKSRGGLNCTKNWR